MNLLILTRYPVEYEPQRLLEESGKAGLRAEIWNYNQLALFWQPEMIKIGLPGEKKLADFDFFIPRSSAHSKKKSLTGLKTAIIRSLSTEVICLNRETFFKWPILGKIEQGVILAQFGIPVIPSWFFADRAEQENFFKKAPWPLILKGRFGSHSRKTFKVSSMLEAKRRLAAVSGEFFYQPLIRSHYYWRVLVLGEQVLGIMRRKTNSRFFKNGFVKNVSDQKLKEAALRAAAAINAEFAGVDLLADQNGEPLVIEVNRTPQFKIFEKKQNINIAEKLVNYMKKQHKRFKTKKPEADTPK
ncbi:MAG: hypothetical protein JW991_04660 [Candidatus Pacebacteria bacterium]|nr:hypothetical protein [Candidatus Paceibacterota bacterium]